MSLFCRIYVSRSLVVDARVSKGHQSKRVTLLSLFKSRLVKNVGWVFATSEMTGKFSFPCGKSDRI